MRRRQIGEFDPADADPETDPDSDEEGEVAADELLGYLRRHGYLVDSDAG